MFSDFRNTLQHTQPRSINSNTRHTSQIDKQQDTAHTTEVGKQKWRTAVGMEVVDVAFLEKKKRTVKPRTQM